MKKQKLKPYLYLFPSILLAFVFAYYPFIISIFSSFFNIKLDGSITSFVFLDNFSKVLTDPIFYKSLFNTVNFMLIFVPSIIGFLLLTIYVSKEGHFSSIFQTIYILPMALGLSSAALLFKFIFNKDLGIINAIFRTNIAWDNEPFLALLSVVFLSLFLAFGLYYLLLLCAFKNIDKAIIEAAKLEGASSRQIFFNIELKQVVPTLSFVIFISIKDAFLISSPIMIMTEGGPFRSTQTLVYYYYIEAFKNSNYQKAYAISTLIFILATVFVFLYRQWDKRSSK